MPQLTIGHPCSRLCRKYYIRRPCTDNLAFAVCSIRVDGALGEAVSSRETPMYSRLLVKRPTKFDFHMAISYRLQLCRLGIDSGTGSV